MYLTLKVLNRYKVPIFFLVMMIKKVDFTYDVEFFQPITKLNSYSKKNLIYHNLFTSINI